MVIPGQHVFLFISMSNTTTFWFYTLKILVKQNRECFQAYTTHVTKAKKPFKYIILSFKYVVLHLSRNIQ